jgi:hypothetical protein
MHTMPFVRFQVFTAYFRMHCFFVFYLAVSTGDYILFLWFVMYDAVSMELRAIG